jgi:hypothetical protein
MSITVKVVQVPGAVKELELENGSTVGTALEVASISTDGRSIQLNGAATTTDAALSDGDKVIVAKGAKGNA